MQVLRTPSVSELADMLARNGQEIVSLDAMQSFRALTKVGNDTVSPVPYDVRYWNVMVISMGLFRRDKKEDLIK